MGVILYTVNISSLIILTKSLPTLHLPQKTKAPRQLVYRLCPDNPRSTGEITTLGQCQKNMSTRVNMNDGQRLNK